MSAEALGFRVSRVEPPTSTNTQDGLDGPSPEGVIRGYEVPGEPPCPPDEGASVLASEAQRVLQSVTTTARG